MAESIQGCVIRLRQQFHLHKFTHVIKWQYLWKFQLLQLSTANPTLYGVHRSCIKLHLLCDPSQWQQCGLPLLLTWKIRSNVAMKQKATDPAGYELMFYMVQFTLLVDILIMLVRYLLWCSQPSCWSSRDSHSRYWKHLHTFAYPWQPARGIISWTALMNQWFDQLLATYRQPFAPRCCGWCYYFSALLLLCKLLLRNSYNRHCCKVLRTLWWFVLRWKKMLERRIYLRWPCMQCLSCNLWTRWRSLSTWVPWGCSMHTWPLCEMWYQNFSWGLPWIYTEPHAFAICAPTTGDCAPCKGTKFTTVLVIAVCMWPSPALYCPGLLPLARTWWHRFEIADVIWCCWCCSNVGEGCEDTVDRVLGMPLIADLKVDYYTLHSDGNNWLATEACMCVEDNTAIKPSFVLLSLLKFPVVPEIDEPSKLLNWPQQIPSNSISSTVEASMPAIFFKSETLYPQIFLNPKP